MGIAEAHSEYSTCLKNKIGIVLVNRDTSIAIGYNGAPEGLSKCSEIGCVRKTHRTLAESSESCRTGYTEAYKAIMHRCYENATLAYISCFPSFTSAKVLISAGVKKIVYKGDCTDEFTRELLDSSGVEVEEF